MKSNLFLVIYLILAGLFLGSCTSDLVVNESAVVEGLWDKNDTVTFDFEINDTLSNFDFFINVRHKISYPYQNIFFFVNTEFPNGNLTNDTIECVLADVRGKWYGRGFGDVKENRILITKNLRFPVSGYYQMKFVQAMREEKLSGLTDIGIQISKASAN